MWFLYCNYHMKPTFHNLRSMMHSWQTLGDSGVENGTFFDQKLTIVDIKFQASFLMSFWLKFGAKKVPKMDPQSQLLKIIFKCWVTGGAWWGTLGPHGAHRVHKMSTCIVWTSFWLFGGRFWTHVGTVLGDLGPSLLTCNMNQGNY